MKTRSILFRRAGVFYCEDTVAPYHQRMPLIVRPDNYADWLGENWQHTLAEPDHTPLDKFQKQPELF